MVLKELLDGEDQLKGWAKQQANMFKEPDASVQAALTAVVTNVEANGRYAPQHKAKFLSGADPWVIAHAAALGGRVITFEKAEPMSKRPKIPDVAGEFGVKCINLWTCSPRWASAHDR